MFVAHIRLEFNYEPDTTDVYDYLRQLIEDGGIEYDLVRSIQTDPMDRITRHMFNEDLDD